MIANNQEKPRSGYADLARGLPMFTTSEAQVLAKEKSELAALEGKGFLKRCRGYSKMTGPGYLQSALTLGGGSAVASLFAGSYRQYGLLWVQPVAMILGIIMLAAISHQTLSTRARPFSTIKIIFHPVLAWIWAFGALAVTIIWHFPQYALAAGMTEDMVKATTGWQPSSAGQMAVLIGVGLVILIVSAAITWNYGSGHKGVRFYERVLKGMVWMIIITFAIVVVRRAIDGGIEWREVLRGFLPLDIPTDKRGVSIVMAAFAAVVGINSTFIFPYTLLARGWGKEHRGLSRFDLIIGMLLPFCIITSLIIIAAGCTIYNPQVEDPSKLSPMEAAEVLQSVGLGVFFSRIVFGLGIIGMALSSITVHMLTCGFAACELFGIEPGGWRYKLACLLPVPGVSGVVLWKYMGPWIAVPTSAVCGLLLPLAYIIFFILNNSKTYLGPDKFTGSKAVIWNLGMLIALLASIASVCYYVYSHI
ncbi:MAG: divalent metal cation transporter [Candidatus Hermodarchaeia archaeon]|jgi:Mn2+/Fe2+ NRAMP family transporter